MLSVSHGVFTLAQTDTKTEYRQGYSRLGWYSVLGLGDDWVQYPFLKPIGLSVAVHQCERTITVKLVKLLNEVSVCAVKMLDSNICD